MRGQTNHILAVLGLARSKFIFFFIILICCVTESTGCSCFNELGSSYFFHQNGGRFWDGNQRDFVIAYAFSRPEELSLGDQLYKIKFCVLCCAHQQTPGPPKEFLSLVSRYCLIPLSTILIMQRLHGFCVKIYDD